MNAHPVPNSYFLMFPRMVKIKVLCHGNQRTTESHKQTDFGQPHRHLK